MLSLDLLCILDFDGYFNNVAGDQHITLDVVPPLGPCWGRGDPGAIARIARILLDNALRFAPPGTA